MVSISADRVDALEATISFAGTKLEAVPVFWSANDGARSGSLDIYEAHVEHQIDTDGW
jgi:hypothetical protein